MTECNECKKDIDIENQLHVIRRYPYKGGDLGTDYYHMSCHDRITRFSEFPLDMENNK